MSNQTEWWTPVTPDENPSDLFGGDGSAHGPGTPEPRRRSRASGRKREERLRKQRRRRSIAVMAVALVLVAGAGYVIFSVMGVSLFSGTTQAAAVTDFPGQGRPGAKPIVINAGDTGTAIAKTLHEAGIVASEKAFRDAFEAHPDAGRIQPGTYQLLLEMKAELAVQQLLDPKSKVSMKLTIPEGWTAQQIFDKVNEVTLISVEEIQAAAADAAAIGLPAEANGNVEGWLYPTTYQFEPDTTATQVLSQMVAKTVEVLTAKGVAREQWAPVLIKASLVEREGKHDEDRPKMARAIENRLDKGMRLQIDASLAYGLGISGTQLTRDMLQTSDSPYNLERVIGLPPTPIASPGEKSIDAVLNPAEGPWLFWMTVNLETGETRFATTNDEHEENRALYRQWQAQKEQEG